MRGERAGLWTALPGIIQSFDADKMTVVVQPALKGVVAKKDGTAEAVNLPLLPDVPVVFPSGGGCTLTFPIAEGDECLVVFSSRCIDGWWQSGGIQLPMEPRMHDLSDGFAILGPKSQPRKIANLSSNTVQLRSDDGEAFIQINPTTHKVDVVTSGQATVHAETVLVQATGDVGVDAGGNLVAQAGGDVAVSGSKVTTAAGGTNTVSGSYVMLGQGSAGNLAQLPGDAGALFDSYMAGGSAMQNPVSAELSQLSDAIVDPQIETDLDALVADNTITAQDKIDILESLEGDGITPGGLADAATKLTDHTNLLSGVTTTLSATIPQFDRVVGLAGSLDNVVGGAFGAAEDLVESVTSGLSATPLVTAAKEYVSGFTGLLAAGTATVSDVISSITDHANTLKNVVTSDTNNYNALQNQITKASGFLGAVSSAKSPNPAVQSLVGKVMSPSTIDALKSVGG